LNLGLPIRLQDVEGLPEEQQVAHLRLLGLPDSIRRELDTDTLTATLLPVTAPFDGLVVQRNVAPGEVVQATQAKSLFVVADPRHLHIELDANPQDMAEVCLGQTVTFRSGGKAAVTATGKVSHISPEVDSTTRRVRVHAEVSDPDGGLRANTFGT